MAHSVLDFHLIAKTQGPLWDCSQAGRSPISRQASCSAAFSFVWFFSLLRQGRRTPCALMDNLTHFSADRQLSCVMRLAMISPSDRWPFGLHSRRPQLSNQPRCPGRISRPGRC